MLSDIDQPNVGYLLGLPDPAEGSFLLNRKVMNLFSVSTLRRMTFVFFLAGLATGAAFAETATTLGGVNTSFHLFGSHDVQVSSFRDPDLSVTCYLSRAQTGGIKGAIGVARNPTRFSLACVKMAISSQIFPSCPSSRTLRSCEILLCSQILLSRE